MLSFDFKANLDELEASDVCHQCLSAPAQERTSPMESLFSPDVYSSLLLTASLDRLEPPEGSHHHMQALSSSKHRHRQRGKDARIGSTTAVLRILDLHF